MIKISVIMGVYNCKSKERLKKSIESIINQSFSDWEFVICNDGSTDDTLSFLKKIAKVDDRIKIISYEKNKGLAYALNECIAASRGEFIGRQDDDDISLQNRLEQEYEFLVNHPEYDLVGTIADIFDDNGVWGTYLVPECVDKHDFLYNSPFLHPSILVRKNSLLKVSGYRVAKETRRCEDYDLFMRMYARGMKGYNIQEKLYHYRIQRNEEKRHRPMKYRVDELKVRYKGFKLLKIGFKKIPYIFKPIIAGLIPNKLLNRYNKRKYKEKTSV